MRFYTEDKRGKIEDEKAPEVLDWRSVFSSVYNDSGEPPFRDSMSVDFLERLDIMFVDGDWYSVIYNEVRMPLSSLDEGIKIALSAITCSKWGKYMWFSQLGYEFLDKLAYLPVDILFAICRSELEDIDCVTSGVSGCKFVNFPYQGSVIEVVCRPFHVFRKDHYKGILCGDDGKF